MQLGKARRRTVETSAREDVRERSVRCLGAGARILRYIAERSAAQHEAACRVIVSSQHLQQAGLACSVAAYQPDFVPWRDGEAGVGQHTSRGDVDGETTDLEHDGMLRAAPRDVLSHIKRPGGRSK